MLKKVIVITAGKNAGGYWRDLWGYRELLFFLAWRDILVQYKQTVIGIAWAIIRPLLTLIVFSIIFGSLAKLPSGGVPYPLLVLSALLPWQFFANCLSGCSGSILANSNMISKVYFPRLIIPVSTVVLNFVDFAITFALLILLMFYYQVYPTWRVFALIPLIILAMLASLGAGLWFAALNTKYRDFRYIVPFAIQFGLYISPVGFSSAVVPEKWRFIYSLNPMVAVIDGFRWAITGDSANFYLPGFLLSCGLILFLLVTGLIYFKTNEKNFADII